MKTHRPTPLSKLLLISCFLAAGCAKKGAGPSGSSSSGGMDSTTSGTETTSGDEDSTGGTDSSTGDGDSTGGSDATSGGGDSTGGESTGGTNTTSDGGDMGGDSAGQSGTGSSSNSETCGGDPCPEWGTCKVTHDGDQCVRTCSFEEAMNSTDGPRHVLQTADHVAKLAALKCTVIDGPLEVHGDEIVDLPGLDTIQTVTEGLKVSGASKLTSLEGLANLKEVGSLYVKDCGQLSTIDFPVLTSTGDLTVTSMPALTALDLPLLKNADNVTINVNTQLSEINMDSLQAVAHGMIISSNSSLKTLHGLPALKDVSSLLVSINKALPQCEVDAIAARVGGCDSCDGNDTSASCN